MPNMRATRSLPRPRSISASLRLFSTSIWQSSRPLRSCPRPLYAQGFDGFAPSPPKRQRRRKAGIQFLGKRCVPSPLWRLIRSNCQQFRTGTTAGLRRYRAQWEKPHDAHAHSFRRAGTYFQYNVRAVGARIDRGAGFLARAAVARQVTGHRAARIEADWRHPHREQRGRSGHEHIRPDEPDKITERREDRALAVIGRPPRTGARCAAGGLRDSRGLPGADRASYCLATVPLTTPYSADKRGDRGDAADDYQRLPRDAGCGRARDRDAQRRGRAQAPWSRRRRVRRYSGSARVAARGQDAGRLPCDPRHAGVLDRSGEPLPQAGFCAGQEVRVLLRRRLALGAGSPDRAPDGATAGGPYQGRIRRMEEVRRTGGDAGAEREEIALIRGVDRRDQTSSFAARTFCVHSGFGREAAWTSIISGATSSRACAIPPSARPCRGISII